MTNPQWLRSFSVLAELGNFTRTAEHLDITQAAVSQHIRRLEDELGPLLIRRPRSVELTPAGLSLLAYCNEVKQADKRLKLNLSGADKTAGEISLITPGSVGLALYPALLDLQTNHPNLSIRHRFAPDPEVLQSVLANQYELGLVTLKPDDARITADYFGEEPLELVIPAGHTIKDWEDLQSLGFINHPDGKAMADRLLSRLFAGQGHINDIPIHGFINQISLILEPVSRGLGFTVIPRHARQAFAKQDQIHALEWGDAVVETLWLIHRAEWPLSKRAAFAVEVLKGHIGD